MNVPPLTIETDLTLSVPVVAPVGTDAVSFVDDATVAVTQWPLNETVAGDVNPVPFTVTVVCRGPEVGENDVTVGVIVSDFGLVALVDPTNTEIVPVVDAAGTVAVILVEETTWYDAATACTCTADTLLSPVPLMVMVLPAEVVVGDTDEIFGADAAAAGFATATVIPVNTVAIATTAPKGSKVAAEKRPRAIPIASSPHPEFAQLWHNQAELVNTS